MHLKKITHVFGSEWEGIYIDGVLVNQGHSFTREYVLNLAGIKMDVLEVDEGWMEQRSHLPSKLEDVKFASEEE